MLSAAFLPGAVLFIPAENPKIMTERTFYHSWNVCADMDFSKRITDDKAGCRHSEGMLADRRPSMMRLLKRVLQFFRIQYIRSVAFYIKFVTFFSHLYSLKQIFNKLSRLFLKQRKNRISFLFTPSVPHHNTKFLICKCRKSRSPLSDSLQNRIYNENTQKKALAQFSPKSCFEPTPGLMRYVGEFI